ncbi:efflux RND transporter permease subunit [Marinobacter segnicrescens]|uniref:efflux RND transporter permease subunit n=1 Tax=Marinobacter segnicrescens TaxID=430453 RepID=UPI003A8E80A2
MRSFYSLYDRLILNHPWRVLILFAVVLVIASLKLHQFRLDASAESLVLENDTALEDYRTVSQRFEASDDFLVVTYKPDGDLFSQPAINTLRNLRDDLAALGPVGSTNSILNVPLLHSPDLGIDTVDEELLTLDQDEVPLDQARDSLLSNPLYPNMLISEDASTTAIQVNLPTPDRYFELVRLRNDLREQARIGELNQQQRQKLEQVSEQFRQLAAELEAEREQTITDVRAILDRYRDNAEIHLGGVPMIASDMIRFIESDLSTFGVGVLIFLLLTLVVIFRSWQWVVVPILCCGFTVWLVAGYLGWMQWPVTVISSNFVSLLLIMTLSLTIHLMVRYREHQQAHPQDDRKQHLRDTLSTMVKPCFYMALTTMVAFGSLTFSGIRPVIDFGWMMTLGLALAFAISFLVFPVLVALLPEPPVRQSRPGSLPLTDAFARITERFGGTVLAGSLALAVLCVVGMSRLSVENSFIDYFKSDTEIHQGMVVIDQKLGGTTPLDIIITDLERPEDAETDPFASDCDPFVEDCEDGDLRDTWFTWQKLDRLEQVHDYLAGLPETGKVLSVTTTLRLLAEINGGEPLNAMEVAFVPAMLPDDLAPILLTPYINEEHHRARINIRLIDSLPDLRRDELLAEIRNHLHDKLGFEQGQLLFTGMTVMYNNMLQSLFDSQIRTLGIVFLAITIMFFVLFRSLKMALIGIAPNLLAAGSVLGLMGWLGIPLDMMTITVAAITVGIAVDDTIHYIHRFRVEFEKDRDYIATMHRCHQSIGRAMSYTTLTIIIGFSILVLSNFLPTIYFGLFTGFAMFMALMGALMLLPRLILLLKPFGPAASH